MKRVGSEVFKKTLDMGLCHTRPPVHPVVKLVGLILNKNLDLGKISGGGYDISSFDWDGKSIWTPCDCGLATNKWSAKTGEIIKRLGGGIISRNYKTLYVHLCGEGVIYGNGVALLFSNIISHPKVILEEPFEIHDIYATKDGSTIILLKDDKHLTIIERSNSSNDFREYSILTNNAGEKLKFFENTPVNMSYIFRYSSQDLNLISLKEKSVVNSCTINGIKDFSKHPDKDLLIVLGDKLTLLSLPDLEIISSANLSSDRDASYGVINLICYSPCGKYLALSYATGGKVEIWDARELKYLYKFDGAGVPMYNALSWDFSGRYLACSFKHKASEATLIVWDAVSKEEVLKTESSCPSFNLKSPPFKWSPTSTKIACLVGNKRIQIFENK